MLELRNVKKTYNTGGGTVKALDGIDLRIEDGEIFGIIGFSGAGKSTLVRCLNLLEKPDSGQVLVDGRDLMRMRRKELLEMRRSIGMIFQGFNLLEQRTALKNVCFPLETAGAKEPAKRAMEMLELVGLADRADAYPSQLSGGQKQRVAIARALATGPKYLLCDEATSALDPATTQSILQLLRHINRSLSVTVVVITHEMQVIDRICDRVVVLDGGRIAESGPVTKVFVAPRSDVARRLILPGGGSAGGGRRLRLVFDGSTSNKPVISDMVLACRARVNILFADMREIDGMAFGQMLLELPEQAREQEKLLSWLGINSIHYEEVV